MFYKKWDDISIINHIMSKYGKKPLNSSYFATNYPAVYAAAERIFGSWKNAIEACGLDYNTIRKYRIWSKEIIMKEIKKRHKSGQSLNSKNAYKTDRPLYMAAVKRYKNWGTAVKAAGIDYSKVRLRRMMSKSEIRQEILGLYQSGVDLAYTNMRENHLYLFAAGMKKLGNGSWARARRNCGIRENYRMYFRRWKMRTQL
ncbi:MAG: hypothetical protein WC657_05430 [Candidatus Paceibacterota bacterium]|jgi:hypothetical protein